MFLKKEWLSSLSVRSVFQLTAVGVAIGVLISGNAIVQQRRTVLAEMEQRAALLGESLGNACSLPYLLGDKQTVSYLLSKAATLQDILVVNLLNREGKVDFEAHDPSEKGLSGWAQGQRPDARQLKVWDYEDSIHVLVPLRIERQESSMEQMLNPSSPAPGAQAHGDTIGYLYIRLSPARARQLARDFIRRSVLFTLGAVIFGSIVVFILQRKTVLAPIRHLVEAMSAFRGGNLDVIPTSRGSANEIGILIRAFNEMAAALRKTQKELKEINAELEQRVLERTKDLANTNQELQDTQERVVRSEKLAAIGQLASGVGHELRNPLAAISNAIYYLRDALKGTPLAASDPSLVEFLDMADREIRGATHIIHDLLDFSRISKIDPQPTDINALLREAKSVIEIPSTVRVIENLETGLKPANIDREKMRQVFVNLIQNGVQAMPKGGELRVESKLGSHPDSGRQVFRIEISDTGTGIKPEDRPKIFEPLFTTKAKGTGLGLPISLGIVQKHGGEIVVASKVGEGTSFTVLLPAEGSTNVA